MEFRLELTVDRPHVHQALKALISTILFYRTFGSVMPETREFLETPYPACIPAIDDELEAQIHTVLGKLDAEGDHSTSSTPFGSPATVANPYANISFDDDTSGGTLRTLKGEQQQQQQQQQQQPRCAEISVKFYEPKKLKKPSWFGKTEEEVYWETWLVHITVLQGVQSEEWFSRLNQQFEALVQRISDCANDNKEHIPIITSAEMMPFGYTIQLVGSQGWHGFIKKILTDS